MVLVYPVAFWNPGNQGGGGNPDPHANNVVLFLKGNGTNNTSIIDTSINPKNITVFGDTRNNVNEILFDGNQDYLELPTIASTPSLGIFGKDYTIEAWINTVSTATQAIIGNLDDGTGQGSWWLIINSSVTGLHQIQFFARNASQFKINPGQNFPTNQRTHLAVCKAGNTANVFLNGILQGSLSLSGTVGGETTMPFYVGASWHRFTGVTRSYSFNGNLNVRLTENIVRYTTNFNPETDTYLN